MHANEDPSPTTAQAHPGPGATAPTGRRPPRRWRPRTRILALAGATALAATAIVGGVTLASSASPASAATKPAWIMTAGNIQRMSQQDPATTSYFFNTPTSYGAGASLVRTPVQAGYATTPVLAYTSYAQFSSDIQNSTINYPYKWVLYDPENWASTPPNEQQNPVKYMRLFGQLAHANGLKVIQAPARDLGSVAGTVLPRLPRETIDQWYVRVNLAGAAGAAADIYQLQDEANIPNGGQYAWLFNRTQSQARAANPNVKVYSEVSTVNGTAAQMATAAKSINPDGFYVAAPSVLPAVQFFQMMKAAGY